ncbi:MAG: GntR family transcriptional regulator, partial [Candidatus Omnitrophica bacterium]|nr:GntR family transcriptional regulator [Candidatus Omnitrophota bacterium]
KFFYSIICIQNRKWKNMKTKTKRLREKIIKYLMKKGKDNGEITEEAIASYFKVSRTPVREVLKHLEQEGIIQTKRNAGIKFKEFGEEEIKDMYDVRALLEGFAIREGVKNITENDIKELKEYVKMYHKARKNKDRIKGEEADRVFHKKIIELSGNRYLISLVDKLNLFSSVFKVGMDKNSKFYYRRYDLNPYSHTKIIKAISTGNPDIAEESIKNHILWARDYAIKSLKKGGDKYKGKEVRRKM